MNPLPQPLPPPDSFEQSSSMWVDEAIWGHRLYDEQLPWLVFLEFLNVFTYADDKGRALDEQGRLNELTYRAAHRLYLRNILFNNPHLAEVRMANPDDSNRWNEWLRRMKGAASGLNHPEFDFLKQHFHTFEDFCEVVSLVRSTSLEVNSNKRWTSKFVFPYGRDCLYEDLDNNASTNDRRFFGRTGELLYLMLSRTPRKLELLASLKERLAKMDHTWEAIISCLQPKLDEDMYERANAFLPYSSHPCFDDLADDWLAILRLSIPGFDVLPHLVNLAGLHLLKYQLSVSEQYLGSAKPLSVICEVVAPKKTLVREVSCDLYQSNNLLPAQAVETFITNIERSAEWQRAITESNAFERCRRILKERARWGEDYEGPTDAGELISRLRQDAMKRHRQHVANIHRNYGREVGLVSKRGTVKLRYAPTDALLKTLLFANVEKRIELHRFLARLHARYGLVFGDKEAERVLSTGEFEKKAFQGNSRRLEQRLGSLGLLRRLSDGCAYVVNPYHAEPR
jgi:hypothetical protein